MKRDVVLQAEYPHPPQLVWRALTDRAAMARWLMESDFEPRVGHRFRFRAKPQPGWDGIVNCEVLVVEEPRKLSYAWQGNAQRSRTTVTWTLEPTATGTRLLLEHRGFEGFKDVLLSFMLGSGWKKMLAGRFRELLAGLPLSPAECHTDASAAPSA